MSSSRRRQGMLYFDLFVGTRALNNFTSAIPTFRQTFKKKVQNVCLQNHQKIAATMSSDELFRVQVIQQLSAEQQHRLCTPVLTTNFMDFLATKITKQEDAMMPLLTATDETVVRTIWKKSVNEPLITFDKARDLLGSVFKNLDAVEASTFKTCCDKADEDKDGKLNFAEFRTCVISYAFRIALNKRNHFLETLDAVVSVVHPAGMEELGKFFDVINQKSGSAPTKSSQEMMKKWLSKQHKPLSEKTFVVLYVLSLCLTDEAMHAVVLRNKI
eukprot:PhF_6_TR13869/c0_g1_i1/m.22258